MRSGPEGGAAPMKVLMVGPDRAMRGGVSSVVDAYLRSELVDRVTLRYHATTLDGGKLGKAWRSLSAVVTFPGAALAFRPDLVHIHHASGRSFYRKLLFLAMCKALRLRTVVHSHSGTFPEFRDSSWLNALLVRWFLDGADACIALSGSWRDVLAGFARHPRVHVVHNAVDLSAFAPARAGRAARGEGGDRVVLTMGRLSAPKGTYDLLEAIPLITEAVPQARFVLAGDGAVEDVRRRVDRMGLAGIVRTPGWVSGEARLRQISDCDVFALPSRYEGMPMAILEAMAMGKPIVSTRVGAIPEVVQDGVNGYLVAPGDVRALADRVALLLRDAAQCEELGRRARQRVEESFSTAAVMDALLAVYESVRRGEGVVATRGASERTASRA
jgi:glycosyltransferase involved in cell wall biosynthesis